VIGDGVALRLSRSTDDTRIHNRAAKATGVLSLRVMLGVGTPGKAEAASRLAQLAAIDVCSSVTAASSFSCWLKRLCFDARLIPFCTIACLPSTLSQIPRVTLRRFRIWTLLFL